MRGCIETLSLSALLVINLSFMVLLMLGLCTVLVVTGADGGFIYHDGRIGIWGSALFYLCRVQPDRGEHGGDDADGFYPPIAAEH